MSKSSDKDYQELADQAREEYYQEQMNKEDVYKGERMTKPKSWEARFDEEFDKYLEPFTCEEKFVNGVGDKSAKSAREKIKSFIAQEIQRVKDSCDKYEKFFDWCIQHSFDGCDLDGGTMQDYADKLGLIVLCVIPDDKLEEYDQCIEYDTNEIYFHAGSEEAKKWAKPSPNPTR